MYSSYDNYNDYEEAYYRDEEDDIMEDIVDDLVEEYLIEN